MTTAESEPRYALLGSGRLARHLGHYFRTEGLAVRAWARRPDPDFNDLDLDAHPDPEARLEATVVDCGHVLVLFSDRAIAPFIAGHACLRGKTLIHCSGALALEAAHGAHPLMTFAGDLYAPELYRRIPFVTDAEGPGFAALFPGLANPSHTLPRALKPLYHAYCVASGNFTSLLWERVFREFEAELGLPKAVLLPYMERIFANLAAADGVATGPLVRRDMATIERNLAALAAAGSPLEDVYRAFLRLTGIEAPPKSS